MGGDSKSLERRGSEEERDTGQTEVGDTSLRVEGDVDSGMGEGSGEGRLGEEGEVAAQQPAEGERKGNQKSHA